MKNSLLALTALAVLMSGCAQKGTITIYGQDQKPTFLNMVTIIDYVGLCSNDDFESVLEYSSENKSNNVAVELTTTIDEKTNTTSETVKYEKQIDGRKTLLKICFLDESRKMMKFEFSDVISETKPLITLETENAECLKGETNSSSTVESQNSTFVTCKSK